MRDVRAIQFHEQSEYNWNYMHNLSSRQFNILKSVINAYIKTAKPVSSKSLAKKYNFDISPATVRNEFQILENKGYIYQPHTSAGRIPTDLGFKIFAASPSHKLDRKIFKITKKLLNDFMPRRHSELFFPELVEAVSDLSDSFAAICFKNRFYKYGVSELFRNLLLSETDDFIEIAEDIENLENNFYSWTQNIDISGPMIFIGKESPITSSGNLSIIMNKISDNNQNVFSFIIGPKRMKYDRNLAIIESINELF